ncbi:hypothetical protein MMC18_007100 [Xylographa bjoerkii]|nr:hypothetical protein [Xylographa bjoerkii]
MRASLILALVASLSIAVAAPIAFEVDASLEKREEGIYVYYPPRKEASKEKREEGIYDYYPPREEAAKEKREEGIYVYYPPRKESSKEKRSPQDFADEVDAKA